MTTVQKAILDVEKKVMGVLLKHDHPASRTLFQQWEGCVDRKVSLSGAGFFVDYTLAPDAPVLDDQLDFELNANGAMTGLQYGVGFTLFIKKGCITMLEGYSYEEPWPEMTDDTQLSVDATQLNWDHIGKGEEQ